MSVCIITISMLATTVILLLVYLINKKYVYVENSKVDFMLSNVSITFAVFVISFLTLIICKSLSYISTEPIKTIIDSGIQIPILMMFFSFFFKIFYKKIFKQDLRSEIAVVTISYIISCIFIIVISFTYLKDWSMGLLFIAILLGKFIWFDGASLSFTRENLKMFFSHKFLLFIMVFCIVFIAILCIAEINGVDNLLSIFIGVDFGMGLAGIIIVLIELKKGSIYKQK